MYYKWEEGNKIKTSTQRKHNRRPKHSAKEMGQLKRSSRIDDVALKFKSRLNPGFHFTRNWISISSTYYLRLSATFHIPHLSLSISLFFFPFGVQTLTLAFQTKAVGVAASLMEDDSWPIIIELCRFSHLSNAITAGFAMKGGRSKSDTKKADAKWVLFISIYRCFCFFVMWFDSAIWGRGFEIMAFQIRDLVDIHMRVCVVWFVVGFLWRKGLLLRRQERKQRRKSQ